MYTYNIFVFGHDLSKNKDLNNSMEELCGGAQYIINGKKFKINRPYHGGQVRGDTFSVIFGIEITDDDDNPNYINKIKKSKKENYIEDYNLFINKLKEDCNKEMGVDNWYDKMVKELFEFIDNNEPDFYTVEASS